MRLLTLAFLFTYNLASSQSNDSLIYALGKLDYSQDARFVKIPDEHTSKSGMYLRKEALDAFIRMKEAAQKDGIELKILSAARNFNYQKSIWEAKWNGQRLVNGQNLRTTIPNEAERAKEILKYSSMPGTSRHHWGTDIDINSLNPSYFESGRGKKEYEWLRDNAHLFGFCQTYTQKDSERPNGYEEEKWHWSYVPIAKPMLAFYKNNVTGADMKGFDGAGSISLDEVQKYVFGISNECQ